MPSVVKNPGVTATASVVCTFNWSGLSGSAMAT
jgi:hypothetical protein